MKIVLDESRLTLNDLADFEDATGVGFGDVLAQVEKDGGTVGLGSRVVIALVWICGRHDNPGLTLTQAGEIRVLELDLVIVNDGG